MTRLKNSDNAEQKGTNIGVIGLGLMGSSIATCLLASGHPLNAVEFDEALRGSAKQRILAHLGEMKDAELIDESPAEIIRNFHVHSTLNGLANSQITIEAVIESESVKKKIINKLEKIVSADCIITSNTSAIPISLLQADMEHPNRFVGMHWAEPAHVTRFLEIICGDKTDRALAQSLYDLACSWQKEPSLLKKDIRGFVTNRLMYALMREAFHLVESGVANIDDIDRSARNDLGWWMTLAGPFRFMDLTGVAAYADVARDLFPELSNSKDLPEILKKLSESGAQGISNGRGFYDYTPEQARKWKESFEEFSFDIRKLALKYPSSHGDKVTNL